MSNIVYPVSIDSFYDPNNTTDTMASVPHNVQHGQVNDAVTAVETKVGTGASTPSSGTVLVGTGAGASTWLTTLTNFSITTGFLDSNNRQWIGENPAGSGAVNYPNLGNSATGVAPTYGVAGTDNNIDNNLTTKGSGKVRDNGSALIDFRSSFPNFVGSGGIWTQNSGLIGSMTAMTVWIAGVEYIVSAIASHTFGASVDTYIDYLPGTGITYNAVANNAASYALASGAVRIGIVTTGTSAISNINQGSPQTTEPVVSSNVLAVSDSLGNLIYPKANQKCIGYRYLNSNQTTTSTSSTSITGLDKCVVNLSGTQLVKAYFGAVQGFNESTGDGVSLSVYDVTASAIVAEIIFTAPDNNYATNVNFFTPPLMPPAGTRTYAFQWSTGASTAGLNSTIFLSLELC